MFQKLIDTTLYYEEYGEGDRYILSTCQIFDPDREGWPYDLVQEGFHVYMIQMRGYGQSSHVTEDYGDLWYDIWAKDVVAFANAKGIDQFFYTGASDGGGVGWHLCVRHPERLVGFAALAAGPHSRSIGLVSPSRTHIIDSANSQTAVEALAQYQRQTILRFARQNAHDPQRKQAFERKAEAYYQEKLNMKPEERRIQPGLPLPWLKTDEAVLEALSEISFPVLMINGLKDAMLPFHKAIQPMMVIPNSKAVYYQEATHRIFYCRPDDLRREISSFANDAFSALERAEK